ncbi:proprotein convertase P-domain-containing protein [Streptomyces sp. NPDC058308]|uniref:proprotein convertase P-domain-containing protein n=1 Tax=Streptomyces sp. NPDC058308 TaxID=3346440 RepID=UPI0036EDA8FB
MAAGRLELRGQRQGDLHGTCTVNASSEVANGAWKLKVQGKAAQDTGCAHSGKVTFP